MIDDCLLAALNFSTFNSRESTLRVDFKMLNVNRFDFIKVWCWDELYQPVQDTKFLGSVSCISSITLEIRLNQLLLMARYLDLILSTSRKPGDLETWVLHSFQRIYIYLFNKIFFFLVKLYSWTVPWQKIMIVMKDKAVSPCGWHLFRN